jgi:endonuclease YncB( thermonuclease family)
MKPTLTLAALLVATVAPPAWSQEVRGAALAIDGDTLSIAGQSFHLRGIDAPEGSQTCQWPEKEIPCGDIARWALMDLIAGAAVSCRPEGAVLENGGRVALCASGGFDLSANMVHTGWALADPDTGGAYREAEARARRNRHGMWKGDFTAPWEWRAQQ